MGEIVVSLPTPELVEAVGPVAGARIIEWDLTTPAPEPEIDLVVPRYWKSEPTLARLAGVKTRLVQSQSIGYDRIAEHLPPGHRYANAATVHETSTAELAVGLMIASQRRLDRFARERETITWYDFWTPSLADRRVLIVGYGGIGKALDARLTGFECDITRVASTARSEPGPDGREVRVHAAGELAELLPACDIVVLTVPHTPDTEKLLNAETLALLPDGALVVNVARGRVVDTRALTAEIESGRLRCALDVTSPEPLPADHPLWRCDNALISPHVGGASSAMQPRLVALIRRQIAHLRDGEPLENVVLDSSG